MKTFNEENLLNSTKKVMNEMFDDTPDAPVEDVEEKEDEEEPTPDGI